MSLIAARVLGIDPGVGRLTWAHYCPGRPAPARFEASGELRWTALSYGEVLWKFMRERQGYCALAAIEYPEPPQQGRGRARTFQHNPRRRQDHDGALLRLAGDLEHIAQRCSLGTLAPYPSQVRGWAALQPCVACAGSGSVLVLGQSCSCTACTGLGTPEFNWYQPNKAIGAWFLAHGATAHSIKARGVLSNEDKRDAMLTACWGASTAPPL